MTTDPNAIDSVAPPAGATGVSTPNGLQIPGAGGARRCGLVAIVGKPNVGKSTLLNALVGQKISITSRKAQTTRHRITGIRTVATPDGGGAQFVFVDTPGFQTRHANALNRSLNKTVLGAVADVDLILFVVEAGRFAPADAKVLSLLGKNIPVLLIANKLDTVHRRADIAPWLARMQAEYAGEGAERFAEFVPMSAKNAKDIERLIGICEKYLPEQPWWYDEDELTDRSEKFLASETVREKLFRLTGDELPYTSTVVIDRFEEEPPQKKGQKRLVKIAATIVVERDGHKAMVIGDKGERIKRIGTETRQELEKLMDAKVFIELWVKVRSGWADDEARVKSFGYE
ncbi:MAG: GTPase Era [Proteobacteria bacterium]|nr:GTPase Era [Pseudomonadota bacterium]